MGNREVNSTQAWSCSDYHQPIMGDASFLVDAGCNSTTLSNYNLFSTFICESWSISHEGWCEVRVEPPLGYILEERAQAPCQVD